MKNPPSPRGKALRLAARGGMLSAALPEGVRQSDKRQFKSRGQMLFLYVQNNSCKRNQAVVKCSYHFPETPIQSPIWSPFPE
jgi:hypothetical protein